MNKGSYVCYLDGDDFYTDDRKLQKQADILDADTGHKYVACGHNGCYYWQSTGETKPIEKPIRECALTAKEYWSFFYIHTNAMMFRNIGLQGIDPYTSGIQIIDNLLTYQFLPYGGVYYIPDCMFNYRQTEDSTFHRRSVYQNYILNALMGLSATNWRRLFALRFVSAFTSNGTISSSSSWSRKSIS